MSFLQLGWCCSAGDDLGTRRPAPQAPARRWAALARPAMARCLRPVRAAADLVRDRPLGLPGRTQASHRGIRSSGGALRLSAKREAPGVQERHPLVPVQREVRCCRDEEQLVDPGSEFWGDWSSACVAASDAVRVTSGTARARGPRGKLNAPAHRCALGCRLHPGRQGHCRRAGGVMNSFRSCQTRATDKTSSRPVWITFVSGSVWKSSLPKLAARWKTMASRTLRPPR